jgi:hypothetical protein
MTTSSSIWFQGPVAEAVTQVNAKGCVFVVFARGIVLLLNWATGILFHHPMARALTSY